MQNICKVADLRYKEVINLHSGARYGYVYDVEIDVTNGMLVSIIILGKLRAFGLLGRDTDIVIPYEKIKKIGDDIILVDYEFIEVHKTSKKSSFLIGR